MVKQDQGEDGKDDLTQEFERDIEDDGRARQLDTNRALEKDPYGNNLTANLSYRHKIVDSLTDQTKPVTGLAA